jgi:hypothetical protein
MAVIKVRIEGADEVIRALKKVPPDTQAAMRAEAKDIATSLADWIKADASAHSRQAARAARSVREANQGFWPVITADNRSKLLFGSIFGMNRKSGWYAKRRYFPSKGSQFGKHIGYPGHWFFLSAEKRQPWVESEWHKAADEVVRRWSA